MFVQRDTAPADTARGQLISQSSDVCHKCHCASQHDNCQSKAKHCTLCVIQSPPIYGPSWYKKVHLIYFIVTRHKPQMSQIRDTSVAADPRESQSPVGLTQIPGRLISALCTVPSTVVQLRLFLYHNFDIDIALHCPALIMSNIQGLCKKSGTKVYLLLSNRWNLLLYIESMH